MKSEKAGVGKFSWCFCAPILPTGRAFAHAFSSVFMYPRRGLYCGGTGHVLRRFCSAIRTDWVIIWRATLAAFYCWSTSSATCSSTTVKASCFGEVCAICLGCGRSPSSQCRAIADSTRRHFRLTLFFKLIKSRSFYVLLILKIAICLLHVKRSSSGTRSELQYNRKSSRAISKYLKWTMRVGQFSKHNP